MLTSMSRIIGCFTVSVSTLFAIACSNIIRLVIGLVLFFCVFLDRDGVEVHKHAKKGTRPISKHLDRISDLLYGL